MFLLGGNQNFSPVYVKSSHILIIWIKSASRTIILVQSRLRGKPKLSIIGYRFLRG